MSLNVVGDLRVQRPSDRRVSRLDFALKFWNFEPVRRNLLVDPFVAGPDSSRVLGDAGRPEFRGCLPDCLRQLPAPSRLDVVAHRRGNS
jgi:hypothetical protein